MLVMNLQSGSIYVIGIMIEFSNDVKKKNEDEEMKKLLSLEKCNIYFLIMY